MTGRQAQPQTAQCYTQCPEEGATDSTPWGFRKGFSNQSWIWILKEGNSR